MPRSRSQSCEARLRSESLIYDKRKKIVCNCGWELRLGYGVAVSLAIFEAKRFCLLALELFVEWQVIHFAGGYKPVVLTFVDITLGFPCALAAVYTIRKRQTHKFRSKFRMIFNYLLLIVIACAILNVATMISIGYCVSVRKRAIASVFNTSMHFYVTTASYKHAIDHIQFVLQCCGHTSYSDWFLFDWQLVDYASREEMSRQTRLSDEVYRDRGVPFSCCNLRVLRPCVHFQMNENDVETINYEGCAEILSKALVKIVFVAYTMTTMLVMTQALLAFFLARIANRSCNNESAWDNFPDDLSNSSSSSPLVESSSSDSSEEEIYSKSKSRPKIRKGSNENFKKFIKTSKRSTGSGKKIRGEANKSKGSGAVLVSGFLDCPEDTSSYVSICKRNGEEVANIKPSVHLEHRVPRKKPIIKGLR